MNSSIFQEIFSQPVDFAQAMVLPSQVPDEVLEEIITKLANFHVGLKEVAPEQLPSHK